MRGVFLFAIAGAHVICAVAQAQEGGGLSNPLWSTPLETLSATRDRPVFTQGRRPPPLAAPPPAPAVVPTAPAPPPFSLIGTVVDGGGGIAVLKETGSPTILRLKVGAASNGWSVHAVAPRSVTLTRGPDRVTLELPKPFPQ